MTHLSSLSELFDAGDEVLPCGTAIDTLLEEAADGPAYPVSAQLTAHQATCPHCQAALREFGQLWAQVRELADDPVPLPAAVRSAVAGQIRQLVSDIWYTLQLTDGGAIRIAARVVATIARDAARAVPGVRAALGRSTESTLAALAARATSAHRHPHAAVGVLGRTAVVDLAVGIRYGDVADVVARQVQRSVIDELRRTIGLRDVAVNITVDDVVGP